MGTGSRPSPDIRERQLTAEPARWHRRFPAVGGLRGSQVICGNVSHFGHVARHLKGAPDLVGASVGSAGHVRRGDEVVDLGSLGSSFGGHREGRRQQLVPGLLTLGRARARAVVAWSRDFPGAFLRR